MIHAPVAAFDFDTFRRLLFSGFFVGPAITTFWITIVAMVMGVTLGLFGAVGRQSGLAPVRWLVAAYLWIFRGTPVLVQIIFWYDGLAEITNNVLNPDVLVASLIALGVNEGAYMTEIVRAGLISVDPGQLEAARSLGMTYRQAMRRIVIPQALRVIIPPTGNEFISMLKTTSLLSIIGLQEIFLTGTDFYSHDFRYFEALAVVSIWYLLLTSVLSLLQSRIEQRVGWDRMNTGRGGGGLMQRMLGVRLAGSPKGAR